MNGLLGKRIAELKAVLDSIPAECGEAIAQAAELLVECFRRGGRVFLFGNGGSAADAQHIAGELCGRFLKDRRGLKAHSLVGDTSALTSLANDYGYEQIFARQLEALGDKGDIAWGLSTSGRSPNVVEALAAARRIGMKTILLTGQSGAACDGLADVRISIPENRTPHIQEAGMLVYHCICEQVEKELFPAQ